MTEEVKKLIIEAKNICIIPSEHEPESLPAMLALFYTLKDLGGNVNPIIQHFPEKFNFLIPSLDFISQPKNFVISIPRNVADVSQVYYEKNEENLKIHLTVNNGAIKKDTISFYFSQTKPDLVITLGILDFQKELSTTLDSFGFLLNAPILNIDNNQDNKKFGTTNIIENKSLSEITLEIIKSTSEVVKKETATCLLAGLTLYYDDFKSPQTNHTIFEIVAELIKKGASRHQVTSNLYKTTKEELMLLGQIFQKATFSDNKVSCAVLESDTLQHLAESNISAAVEKIKTIGVEEDLLVLWQSHSSAPTIKGFFYSKKQETLRKVAQNSQGAMKNGWVFIAVPGADIGLVKNNIFNQLNS